MGSSISVTSCAIADKTPPTIYMKAFALVLVSLSLFGATFVAPESNTNRLPAVFQNDLISLAIPLDNDTLNMYTDTGGKNFLYKSGVKKLGSKRSRKNLWQRSHLEDLLKASGIPLPHLKEIYFTIDKSSRYDGMFGREWFANKIWEFDYDNKTLAHLNGAEKPHENAGQPVKLHFLSDSAGKHISHVPRIQIVAASDTLSVLFDTGAQAFLSIDAQTALHKNERVGISFINASTFDRWKNANPDWLVINGGDRSFGEEADLIVVPEIEIGGVTLGPVEFAKREDFNFKVMSDLFMDQEIIGALGGNALSQLNPFIVDYKSEELRIQP